MQKQSVSETNLTITIWSLVSTEKEVPITKINKNHNKPLLGCATF